MTQGESLARAELDQTRARVAELEAERNGAVRILATAQRVLNEKMDRIAALEAERDRLRDLLREHPEVFIGQSASEARAAFAATPQEETK